MAVTIRELEKIRKEGLKALREKLGPIGMIKFIQLYSNGNGDYTKERQKHLDEITIEEFEKYTNENLK